MHTNVKIQSISEKGTKVLYNWKCMQLTLGAPLRKRFGEKGLGSYNLYKEGLESKLTPLPVFHSNYRNYR